MVGARAPGTEQISQLVSYKKKANFATCTFLTRTKRRKMAFFEGCPVGWGKAQGLGEGGPRASVLGG